MNNRKNRLKKVRQILKKHNITFKLVSYIYIKENHGYYLNGKILINKKTIFEFINKDDEIGIYQTSNNDILNFKINDIITKELSHITYTEDNVIKNIDIFNIFYDLVEEHYANDNKAEKGNLLDNQYFNDLEESKDEIFLNKETFSANSKFINNLKQFCWNYEHNKVV